MAGFKINPEISFGHMLTAGAMLAGAVMLVATIRQTSVVNTVQIGFHSQRIENLENAILKIAEAVNVPPPIVK